MRRLVVLVCGLAVAAVGGTVTRAASWTPTAAPLEVASSSCLIPMVPAEVDMTFHRATDMLTTPAHPPLLSLPGNHLISPATSSAVRRTGWAVQIPAGLALQDVFDADPESGLGLRLYFAQNPLGPDETIVDLLAGGGADLEITPYAGITGDYVRSQVGPRGMALTIGENDATLIHSDEILPGVRPFLLYWSDGTYDYLVQGGTSAEDVIAIGASLYC